MKTKDVFFAAGQRGGALVLRGTLLRVAKNRARERWK